MGGVLVLALLGGAAGVAGWTRTEANKRGWKHPRLAALAALCGSLGVATIVLQFGVAPFFQH